MTTSLPPSTTSPSATVGGFETRLQRFDRWFAAHVAVMKTYASPSGGRMQTIHWSAPGTLTHSIGFKSMGNCLFVTGDLGYAVYRTSQSVELEYWANLLLPVFAGQCVASPVGSGYKVWSESAARNRLQRAAEDWAPGLAACLAELGAATALGSRREWTRFLSRATMIGEDRRLSAIATDPRLLSIGYIVAEQCEAHLTGLNKALQQLRDGRGAR